MKEFRIFIKRNLYGVLSITPAEQTEVSKKRTLYFGKLKAKGKLLSAQSFLPGALLISKKGGQWMEKQLQEDEGVAVESYTITANDMQEAVNIAKENPELEYSGVVSIEIRTVKN